MSALHTKVQAVWEKYPPFLAEGQNLAFQQRDFLEKLGKVYSPGPFFLSVFNFVEYKFLHISPTIQEILGYCPSEWSLETFLREVHPLDIEHFADCEKFVGEFLFNYLSPDLIPNYKSVYSYRIRKKNGSYAHILQQALPITLGEDNRVINSFVSQTDVSHLYETPKKTLSLLSLNGGIDYLDIDPSRGINLKGKKKDTLLSCREIEVLGLLAEGDSLEEIGEKLFISKDTARSHRNNIRRKMNCKKISQAIAMAIREGWL